MYDYESVMKEDVLSEIQERYTHKDIILALHDDWEGFRDELMDALWNEDSVTGNASGSYTFNRYEAREYVLDNMGILSEVVDEYGIDKREIGDKFLEENFEYFDVLIRVYLLPNVIFTIVDEMCDEFSDELEAFDVDDDEE